MKTLLTIFTLTFTLMFSSTSFAEWTKVVRNLKGTSYVDFERIRKVDGFVLYWELIDFLNPDPDGGFSYKIYYKGDCKLFRHKRLYYSYHKEQMGGGTGESFTPPDKWLYPPPDSTNEVTLKSVCSR